MQRLPGNLNYAARLRQHRFVQLDVLAMSPSILNYLVTAARVFCHCDSASPVTESSLVTVVYGPSPNCPQEVQNCIGCFLSSSCSTVARQ